MVMMTTRETLLTVALQVLEKDGEAQFSTRAVCALAGVSAPTLYHHFGSADGLLSAAMTEAFRQFLERKKAAVKSPDPETALRQGWDDYVGFAADRPLLYAAMIARVLLGARIPAAEEARQLLMGRIAAIAADGRLAMASPDAAADLAWGSAHAAALLHVTTVDRVTDPAVIAALRDHAIQTICKPRPKEALP
jgi:AcrR family transcriptional regulator